MMEDAAQLSAALVLNPRESLSERIGALRESRDRATARKVLEGESSPPELVSEALDCVDGSDALDVVRALAHCVPTRPNTTVQEASKVVSRLLVQDVDAVEVIRTHLEANPQRFLIAALWGLSCFVRDHMAERTFTIPVSLVDQLALMATEDFLHAQITESELMGSHRTEALSALALRGLGRFISEESLNAVLYDFAKYPFRACALYHISLTCSKTLLSSMIPKIIESMERAVNEDTRLRKWCEQWYFEADPEVDEKAKDVLIASIQFGEDAKWLLRTISNSLLQVNIDSDTSVSLRMFLLSWTVIDENQGICLPWNSADCARIATQCLEIIDRFHPKFTLNLEVVRSQLGGAQWKDKWFETNSLIVACLSRKDTDLEYKREHLLGIFLPLADDIDPRLAAPAWKVIVEHIDSLAATGLPLLFRAAERAMITKDVPLFSTIMTFLRITLCEDEGMSSFKELEGFYLRILRDCVFFPTSGRDQLYVEAINEFAVFALRTLDLQSIIYFDDVLKAIDAGAAFKRTGQAALRLLKATLDVLTPRIAAHRGKVLHIFTRFASRESVPPEELRATYAKFQAICDQHHRDWLGNAMSKIDEEFPQVFQVLSTK